MTQPQLPKKLSDLIELALGDLIKCERSPKYKIDMGNWHHPRLDKCFICLAGAIIAQSLNVDVKTDYYPSDFNDFTERRLNALNFLRGGNVGFAYSTLDERRKLTHFLDRSIISYEDNPGKFKRQMRKLARDLREAGLGHWGPLCSEIGRK